MARLQLNKSSLARETAQLKTFQQFLPTLDLKRQQLMVERSKARNALLATQRQIDQLSLRVADKVPMLANTDVELNHVVQVSEVKLHQENVVGTHLPVLEEVIINIKPYSLMTKPHWVDTAVTLVGEMLKLRVAKQVQQRRLDLLDEAVVTITQRLNLFDKVLIPQAQSNIKRIKVSLSDEQMAAVVRSKIAKRKHKSKVQEAQ